MKNNISYIILSILTMLLILLFINSAHAEEKQTTITAAELRQKVYYELFNNNSISRCDAKKVLNELEADSYFTKNKTQRILYLQKTINEENSKVYQIIGKIDDIYIANGYWELSFKSAIALNSAVEGDIKSSINYWGTILNGINEEDLKGDAKFKNIPKERVYLLYDQNFAPGVLLKKNKDKKSWTKDETNFLLDMLWVAKNTQKAEEKIKSKAQNLLDASMINFSFETDPKTGEVKFSWERTTESIITGLLIGRIFRLASETRGAPSWNVSWSKPGSYPKGGGITKVKQLPVKAQTTQAWESIPDEKINFAEVNTSVGCTESIRFKRIKTSYKTYAGKWYKKPDYDMARIVKTAITKNPQLLYAKGFDIDINAFIKVFNKWWDGVPYEFYKLINDNTYGDYRLRMLNKARQLDINIRKTWTDWETTCVKPTVKTLNQFPAILIEKYPYFVWFDIRMINTGGIARQILFSEELIPGYDVDVVFLYNEKSPMMSQLVYDRVINYKGKKYIKRFYGEEAFKAQITDEFANYTSTKLGTGGPDIAFGKSTLYKFIERSPGESISKLFVNRMGETPKELRSPVIDRMRNMAIEDAKYHKLRYIEGDQEVSYYTYIEQDNFTNFIGEQNITRSIRFSIEKKLTYTPDTDMALRQYRKYGYDQLSDEAKLIRLAQFFNSQHWWYEKFGYKPKNFWKIDNAVRARPEYAAIAKSLEEKYTKVTIGGTEYTWREVFNRWQEFKSAYGLKEMWEY